MKDIIVRKEAPMIAIDAVLILWSVNGFQAGNQKGQIMDSWKQQYEKRKIKYPEKKKTISKRKARKIVSKIKSER